MDIVKCNKCNIDKPLDQYYKEERWGKIYYKKYCLDCFRKQSRDWKLQNKLKKQLLKESQPEPVPVILENPLVNKKCSDCGEIKLLNEFYKSQLGTAHKNCKKCSISKSRAKIVANKKNTGGSERVPYFPNEYVDEEQKAQTFWVMKLMGWTYNDNGVWSKEGFKDKNNVWYKFKEKKKLVLRRNNNTGRKFAKVHNYTEEVIRKHEEGLDFYELSYIYSCSHTTIRKLVKNYYDEKRSS